MKPKKSKVADISTAANSIASSSSGACSSSIECVNIRQDILRGKLGGAKEPTDGLELTLTPILSKVKIKDKRQLNDVLFTSGKIVAKLVNVLFIISAATLVILSPLSIFFSPFLIP